MNRSNRSRPAYQPKFPRLQLMMKRRQEDGAFEEFMEEEFVIFVPGSQRLH